MLKYLVASALNPNIVKSKNIISPSTMPIDIKIACINPEPKALETTAKVPGPGVAIKIKIAPKNVRVVKKSIYFFVWFVSNGGPACSLTVILEAFTGFIFAIIFEIFLAGSVKSIEEASFVERFSKTLAAAESFIFV